MNDELTRLDEGFPTGRALMRPLARVDTHVTMQFPAVLESASAVRATVRLLLSVDATVDAQVLLDRKGFTTYFAHKRSLSCVTLKCVELV